MWCESTQCQYRSKISGERRREEARESVSLVETRWRQNKEWTEMDGWINQHLFFFTLLRHACWPSLSMSPLSLFCPSSPCPASSSLTTPVSAERATQQDCITSLSIHYQPSSVLLHRLLVSFVKAWSRWYGEEASRSQSPAWLIRGRSSEIPGINGKTEKVWKANSILLHSLIVSGYIVIWKASRPSTCR